MGSKEQSKTKEPSKKVKPSLSKKKQAPPTPVKASTSTEFVADSDRGSESDRDSLSDRPPPKTKVKVNGSKTTKEKSKKVAPIVEQVESSEEEESEEEQSASSQNDEDSEEESEESSENEASRQPTPKKTPSSTVNPTPGSSKPLVKYQLPNGFDRLSRPSSSASSPRINTLLSKDHLAGKQVFLFSMPASVPITALKHLKYDDIKGGKIKLRHDRNDYEIGGDDREGENVKIMVMKDGGKNYTVGKHIKISKTLHFRQAVPSVLRANSKIVSRATIPAKRPARAQPEGLRVRFRSGEIGTVAVEGSAKLSKDEDSSDEDEDDDWSRGREKKRKV